MVLIPHKAAVYRISLAIVPSEFGGVQRIISLQPASVAGTPSINTVENKGAVPPGMYKPTDSIGRFSCQQRTPSCVSTSTLLVF